MPLPAKCSELNPAENARQFLRDNRVSNLVLKSYVDIVDRCGDAWNKTRRPTMEKHVHWAMLLDAQVLINESWNYFPHVRNC